MKVVFSCSLPFALAHGGVQTQLEAIMRELHALDVEVEPERWWDEHQTGDVLQYFGRPPTAHHVRLAQQKGRRVVMFDNLGQTAARSRLALFGQRWLTRLSGRYAPSLTTRLAWEVFRNLDAMVYVTQPEWETAQYLFGARPDRGHVIGHGLEEAALKGLAAPAAAAHYLVSVATIAPHKNTLLLAQAARAAKVPVVFLGKPYSERDPYFRKFAALVDGEYVRHPGFVVGEEKIRWLREARGFVLCSQFESGCIAVYEAAAAGLPMLLSDLPWAAQVYGGVPGIEFVAPDSADLAARLREFHARASRQPQAIFPVPSWREVARKYLRVYETVLQSPPSA